MAVVESVIKSALKDLTEALKTEDDVDAAQDKWAGDMAKIIKDAILSATVDTGIAVSVAGTATAQTGATTAPGSLS